MLIGLKRILELGKQMHIAVGSFNTPTMECLNAVIDAAEELNVPVIIAHAQCHEEYARIDRIGRAMVAVAAAAKVPVCVHLDHGEDFEYCKRAIALGFTSVMIDNSTLPYEDNVRLTKEVVDYARLHNTDVEAELGRLPSREGGAGAVADRPEDLYTDPGLVNDYLDRCGADALAIAFGTAHGIYKTKPVLNMDIISEVVKRTNVPLVMHGGSGISHDQYREVIRRGISKINYYSYMSYAGYAEAKRTVENTLADFYHVLSHNSERAMYEDVLRTLDVFTENRNAR